MSISMIDTAIHHSRTVLSIFLLLIISGTYAYLDISKESSPDIDIPQIYIAMSLEGISSDDSERLLLRPIEQELTASEGVKEMKSTAYEGGGFILLEFLAGFNKEKAIDDVQKAVDKARPDLPDDVDEPDITEVNFSLFPVLVVTLSGDIPERTLLKLARRLQDQIETIPSVLEANIAGNREELLEIIVKPELFESYALDGEELINFFQLSNRLIAAGTLDTGSGSFAIQVPGLFENARDIMNMPLRVSGDSVVKVSDIADIRRTFKDPESFARLNGERAIAIEVVKRSGENIIDTIDRVREISSKEHALWPEGVEISFTQDESEHIKNMLLDLQNNVISAILLVMIIVVYALGLRSAALVGIAIPGAFLSGILVLYVIGLTVNMVVLFALILSVGMLVDGAIVVIEYADHEMAGGKPRDVAYSIAGKRMAWPIISSTATTLAAFAPLLFWPDIVGEFMKYMPITLIAVLSSSLLMALIFVPTLGAIFGKSGSEDDPKAKATLHAAQKGDLKTIKGFTGWYLSILSFALMRPGKVLLIAISLLIGVQFSYAKFGNGVEFFPDVEPEFATILIHARGNLSIFEKDALIKDVEEKIMDVGGIETFYTRVGGAAQQGGDQAEDVIGQIQMQFMDWQMRKPANDILEDIRIRTSSLAGIFIETRKQESGPPTGKAVQIQLSSRFPEKLNKTTDQILSILQEVGAFRDIEDTRPLPAIEWEMSIDRAQASKFGLNTTLIGNYVRMVTNGLQVGEYRPNDSDEEIDIVIRHNLDERTLDQLDRVRIEGPNGSIPISNFVKREAKPAVGTIYRSNQRRIVTIKADLPAGINITAKVGEIRARLKEEVKNIDPDVEIVFRGEDEEQRKSQEFLIKAFIVALFIMAIILVTQFNNFYSALLVLSAVIMSTIGVMIGLMITGQPFGIVMTGVGVIALAGIIVNNNIVLIDTFDYLRKKHGETMDMSEIILRTGAQRLRPVLLTTITTIIGLLPMALQTNIDFFARSVNIGAPSTQLWVQLSTAIVFGLGFSTVLTLIVTPSALMWRDNVGHKFEKIKGKFKPVKAGV